VQLVHETIYRYSGPVFLDPHVLRLHPKSGCGVFVRDYQLEVSPSPSGEFVSEDLFGNTVHFVWFEGNTSEFRVTSRFQFEQTPWNPFGYIVHPTDAAILPVEYPRESVASVSPFIAREAISVPVTAFAVSIAQDVDRQTLPFLVALTQRICDMVEIAPRLKGMPLSPAATLNSLRGACRDVAVLMIDACRAVGLAARFVSGYLVDLSAGAHEMHAWVEVYVPGGGWRGFDPSRGIAVQENYIATAVGQSALHAAPVTGTFRGPRVLADMSAGIQVLVEDVAA